MDSSWGDYITLPAFNFLQLHSINRLIRCRYFTQYFQSEMVQMSFRPQTEIAPEWPNLNTILALALEWQNWAIRAGKSAKDFGLAGATQFPGGDESW